MKELLKKIDDLQKLRGLSDRKFCRSLEIDPSTWSYIKSGKKNPGSKVLSAIARVYPELNSEVLKYMVGAK